MTDIKTYQKYDPEPNVKPGTLAAVNFGQPDQEVWVRSSANIGAWYPLGNEFWVVWDKQRMPPGVLKPHPTWDDVTARGPVTILQATTSQAYNLGWNDGLQRALDLLAEEERREHD